MQTLTLHIVRYVAASAIRPGTAILHPETSRPVVVEEVRSALDHIRFMVRVPGAPRRRSVIADETDLITVLPLASEVERLVNALAVAHRGDVGDDWVFQVASAPLDPEMDGTWYDVYDIGGDIEVPYPTLPQDVTVDEAASPFKAKSDE